MTPSHIERDQEGWPLSRLVQGMRADSTASWQVSQWQYHGCYRRPDTPGLERKFITHSNSSNQNSSIFWCWFLKSQFPQWVAKKARWQLHLKWVTLQEENSEFKEPLSFIMGSKLDCSFGGRNYLYRSRLSAIQHIKTYMKTIVQI